MKKSVFILTVLLLFTAGCGGGMLKITPETDDESRVEDEDQDVIPDEGDTVSDSGDTAPDGGDTAPDGGDTAPDGGDTAPDGGDTAPDGGDTAPDGGDTAPDSDSGGSVNHEDRTVPCTGLPENAEWNTASEIVQTWQDGAYVPSETGRYGEDAAPSTFEMTSPDAVDPLADQCPEGTSNIGGVCEYDNCGQWAYYFNFISWQGMMVYKHDPTSTCYKESSTEGDEVPCCCSTELYKFKADTIQATYSPANPMKYATSFKENGSVATVGDWVCGIPDPCAEGFEYGEETGKCYKCSGIFSFDGEKYQCLTEIGSECTFKCKDGFNWNGESCVAY